VGEYAGPEPGWKWVEVSVPDISDLLDIVKFVDPLEELGLVRE
jgi:hypothetical protein